MEREWYCGYCGSLLNRQPGFTSGCGFWMCLECYHEAYIDDNSYEEDTSFTHYDYATGTCKENEFVMKDCNQFENDTDELIREAQIFLAELEHAQSGQVECKSDHDRICSYLNNFANNLLDRCIEQGSDCISISISEIFDMKNQIELLLRD